LVVIENKMRRYLLKKLSGFLPLVALAIFNTAPISWSGELPVAQPEAVGMSSAKLARIGPAVQALITNNLVAGAVVMIARHGKIVYFEATGQSDVATGQPMERDEIMRFYSMSKPVTSVAVMMLVEAGKINLDDPIARYLPEFKGAQVFLRTTHGGLVTEPARREPTVRDLLRHTGGLTYGFMGDTPVDRAYNAAGVLALNNTLADLTRKVAQLPLLYQPGTRFNYSVSADVLARLVEVVSGQAFDEFLAGHIFKPLDMYDTGFWVPPDKQARFAAVHGPEGNKLKVTHFPVTTGYRQRPTFLSGGGGLVSTARDYMRFCQMLVAGGELDGRRLLRRETVRMMTTNQLPSQAFPIEFGGFSIPGIGFGLGFSVQVEPTPFSAAHIGEYGWTGLASTSFWISPQDDLVVIVLQQLMPYSVLLDQTVKPLVYAAIAHY
jgi:CubicO group peptidase (beta-lactamase class C family)